ncbi:glycine zipper 2TM domain-containing protein [Sulfuriroseicoccus oceanibius]|uniref:Glycine zipper 2TM domain-containing protein n=1 Tax=Sulfuriroseicoccus oceanibius TaxID=2707525 RepID=A0A6B3LC98_9BACT|nr:glycine zipper 2TM domain-containing protein [Sulfuriroseicoccus oceanibius]QQL45228.1 glycine zipper 2TM domain-containing protein [Sulfuriroseicoccus oceanibius]
MKYLKSLAVVAASSVMSLSFVSCETAQGTGTAVGAGTGAALGAVIGNNMGSGHSATGALIGAGLGGLVGNQMGATRDRANAAQAEASRANTQVVTIRNSNGSYENITLRRVQGNVWAGPRGEQYHGIPSARQLADMYAR